MVETITVEVVYASKAKQFLEACEVPVSASIREVIMKSGVLDDFSELALDALDVGIFSRKKKLSDTVKQGDRIEIYRPLEIDPKEARRLRAKQKT